MSMARETFLQICEKAASFLNMTSGASCKRIWFKKAKRAFLLSFSFFSALCFSAQEKTPDLVIEEIQENIYLHKSFSRVDGFGLVSSNGLVVVKDKKAFIVDTPWSESDTAKLVAWIEDQNIEVTGSVSTHSHEDRTAGIKWLNARAVPTYASLLTNQILRKEGKETASRTIEGDIAVLADGLVETFYPGGGHTEDNLVVWLPEAKLLYGGCLIRSAKSRNLGYTAEARITEWSASVEKVLQRYPTIERVLPGHGRIGDVQLLKHTQQLADKASGH